MGAELFLTAYVCFIVALVIVQIELMTNSKTTFMKENCRVLEKICNEYAKYDNVDVLEKEIKRYYLECIQEKPNMKKYFSDIIVWLDAIIFRIDSDYKYGRSLKKHSELIKSVRDSLVEKNPYNKCEKYQQEILCDMRKIKTKENEIMIQNIIDRTEDEFIRLSGEIRKNSVQNLVSILIGVIGIIVSVLMAFVKL